MVYPVGKVGGGSNQSGKSWSNGPFRKLIIGNYIWTDSVSIRANQVEWTLRARLEDWPEIPNKRYDQLWVWLMKIATVSMQTFFDFKWHRPVIKPPYVHIVEVKYGFLVKTSCERCILLCLMIKNLQKVFFLSLINFNLHHIVSVSKKLVLRKQ